MTRPCASCPTVIPAARRLCRYCSQVRPARLADVLGRPYCGRLVSGKPCARRPGHLHECRGYALLERHRLAAVGPLSVRRASL